MLNNDLDLARWRDLLQRAGRVQIPGLLQTSALERLRRCLTDEVPWTLALRDAAGQSRVVGHAELARLGAAGQADLVRQAAADAVDRYAFAYESYMMVTAYLERRDPDLLLHRILEFLNSPAFLGFARALTGDTGIVRVSAQATRYRPGMFLKAHNDHEPVERRRYAYVINLGEDWSADWGGLLQFLDDAGNVVDTFAPRPNSLSLFKVPAWHCVSLVAPWARTPRLAITGWWQG
jgi:Rps23 Pro-64 3,4-dihydroxylase Tpa1-like proline 4-hydroxylase